MNYVIHNHKSDLMKTIQSTVAKSGGHRYIHEQIPERKLKAVLFKWEDRYQINATKQQRWYAKKKGKANSTVILFRDKKCEYFDVWLFVSDGEGVVTQSESLKNVIDKRTRVTITGYELVRQTQTVLKGDNYLQKKERYTKENKPRWTWRINSEHYTLWEKRIQRAIRNKNNQKIEQCYFLLQTMPCFAEMRKQAYQLFKLFKAEYQRAFTKEYDKTLGKSFYGRFKSPRTSPLK